MIPVFPIAYFGSIAYFQAIAQYKEVQLEVKEHFPKQTYRNRCDILGADGIQSLSIPTKRPDGNKTTTDRILLSNDENWRIRHWRAIRTAYQSSAYFDYYGMEVEELLLKSDYSSLIDLNEAITRRILQWLDLDIQLSRTSAFAPVIDDDPRATLLSKNAFHSIESAPYIQVFPGSQNYRRSLSVLDAIFCEGPLVRKIITKK